MVPEIMEAWPDCKLVVVDRPAAESIASLKKADWWGQQIPETLIPRMLAIREAGLTYFPAERILRLRFKEDVLDDKAGAIEKLVAFAGIAPTEQQRADAMEHMTDSLYRNRIPEIDHAA
jgi:hypothetical protein